MKKLILLASACLFLNTSCRKDDDDNESISDIVGTWKIEKWVVAYGNGSNETDTPNACEAKSNVIFGSDNKLTGNDYFGNEGSCVLESTNGTYSYDANTKVLKLSAEGEDNYTKVEKLNSSELVVIFSEDDFDDDGKMDKEYIYFKK